jgi:hypothetical protein
MLLGMHFRIMLGATMYLLIWFINLSFHLRTCYVHNFIKYKRYWWPNSWWMWKLVILWRVVFEQGRSHQNIQYLLRTYTTICWTFGTIFSTFIMKLWKHFSYWTNPILFQKFFIVLNKKKGLNWLQSQMFVANFRFV